MLDAELLNQFVTARDEAAFAELVGRYADMVYSAARRQTSNSELADDITQQVFVTLADKAKSIREGEALAGWLLVTTRYVALNALRTEARRRHHEHEAAAMASQQAKMDTPTDPNWEPITGQLDQAVAELKREDRDALALRFFQGKSIADVATALGISVEAAQKRVSRAVGRLRDVFAARGVMTSEDALASMMVAHVLIKAPAALKAALTAHALSSAAASALTSKGALTVMAAVKTKTIVVATAAVLLLGVTGTIAYQAISAPGGKTRQVKVDPSAQTTSLNTFNATRKPAPPPPTNWQAKFREVYALPPGKVVKFVPKPWIPERLGFYYETFGQSQYDAIPTGPDLIMIQDDGTAFHQTNGLFGGPPDVIWAANFVMGIRSWDLRAEGKLLRTPLQGDWVARANSSPQERLPDFVATLAGLLKMPRLSLVKSTQLRDAVVISGTFESHPLQPRGANSKNFLNGREVPVIVYRGTTQPADEYYGGQALDEVIASTISMPVVVETATPLPRMMVFRAPNLYLPNNLTGPKRDAEIASILQNVKQQTSLNLKIEKRNLPVWDLGTVSSTQPATQH